MENTSEIRRGFKELFMELFEQGLRKRKEDAIREGQLDQISDEDLRSELLLSASVPYVQGYGTALEDVYEYLYKNYRTELDWKGDKYPRGWMRTTKKKDKLIRRVIDGYPTMEILNFLFNYNKDWRGEKLNNMIALADSITGGKRCEKNGKLHPYSTFIANEEFYAEMEKKVGRKKRYIQLHFKAFKEYGVLRELGKDKRKGRLYADGWFQQNLGYGWQKFHFLHQCDEHLEMLSKIPELVRTDKRAPTPR